MMKITKYPTFKKFYLDFLLSWRTILHATWMAFGHLKCYFFNFEVNRGEKISNTYLSDELMECFIQIFYYKISG